MAFRSVACAARLSARCAFAQGSRSSLTALCSPSLRPQAGRPGLAASGTGSRLLCAATAEDTKYFLLTYDYVPDILEKRAPYREKHLALAKEQVGVPGETETPTCTGVFLRSPPRPYVPPPVRRRACEVSLEPNVGHLRALIAAGHMLKGGPLNPPVGAVFLWKCAGSEQIEEYVKKDPYVTAGLVPGYSIKEWTVLLE